MKISFYVFRLKSVVSKFQPSISILKNDLEISENCPKKGQKMKISKKEKKYL